MNRSEGRGASAWGRRAQNVKALAQHKNAVTRVTECQRASCQMTHNHLSSSLERTKGGGEVEGIMEETQKEGRRRQAPLLTAGAGPAPAPQACGLSALQEGGRNRQAVQRPSLGDQLQMAGGHQLQRQHGSVLTQPSCPSVP